MKAADDGEQHQHKSKKTEPNPPTSQQVETETGQNESRDDQQAAREKPPPTSDPPHGWPWAARFALIFDGLVAIATVAGVYFLVQQVGQTDQALREAKESNRLTRLAQARERIDAIGRDQRDERLTNASEDSALAARNSASAAKALAGAGAEQAKAASDANQLSERVRTDTITNEKRANRALVTLGFGFMSPPDEAGKFRLIVQFANVRPTPSYHMRYKVLFAVPSVGQQPAITETKWDTVPWTGDADILFPNDSGRGVEVNSSLTPPQLANFSQGAPFYVWVRLRYCDAFNEVHWVYSCMNRVKTAPGESYVLCGTTVDTEGEQKDNSECQSKAQH